MQVTDTRRADRRAQQRQAARAGILAAARRIAERSGAANLWLRSVAAGAGFAPAALYVYFQSRDELLLALAAEDLTAITRALRTGSSHAGQIVLECLIASEALAAASRVLRTSKGAKQAERLFNG